MSLIVGGDCNAVMDNYLDRTSNTPKTFTKSTIALNNLSKELGVGDVWRLKNPTGRDFTYFSAVHKTFSRIDYFFISKSLIKDVYNTTIETIHISDHAPVTVTLCITAAPIKKLNRWRFNNSLTKDNNFTSYMTKEIEEYFKINKNGEVNPNILWDAFNAYARGRIIPYTSAKKKEQIAKI